MHSKFMVVLLLGASLLGLAGCCTFGVSGPDGYDQFYDTNGEYRLVKRNSDVWMEKIDGSEKRQITHTPDSREDEAYFVSNSKYIAYYNPYGTPAAGFVTSKAFIVLTENDDSQRKEITMDEFFSLANSPTRK